MEAPNELHSHLAERILQHVRMQGLQPGEHLTEASLQPILGTSRGPIRSALAFLEHLGAVEKRPNRGFFLADAAIGSELPRHEDDALYHAIAEDRLSDNLGAIVTETELARRYNLTRHRLARLLDRIAAEGWIEKRRGHGWAFLPLINSPRAYRECYELRLIMEPAAMRLSSFTVDSILLDELTRQQIFIRDEGHRTLSAIELFEANSRLHEGLARMSGNRFIEQTIVRQNQLRRLVEYRRPNGSGRARRVSEEHLEILERIRAGNTAAAAIGLEEHLAFARDEKTRAEDFVALSF